ncbi:TetR/AcrR family transcriptional regulator [bacterium]|nr:TetR/AcrR family transcriptional regulator [bacterium]
MSPKVTQQHKAQRRQQILDAAVRVFSQQGFEQTTMQDVITDAGLSRGGVYSYFPGKDELFQAMLDQLDQQNAEGLQALTIASPDAWSGIEGLLAELTTSLGSASDALVAAVYEYFLTRGRTRWDYLRVRHSRIFDALLELIRSGIEKRELDPVLPAETITEALMAFSDGLMIHAVFQPPSQPHAEQQIAALRLFLEAGLRPHARAVGS